MRASVSRLGVVVVAVGFAIGACSTAASPAPIQIENAVVRITTPESPAAAYLVIVNNGSVDDALTAASSPAFKTIELHETRVADSGMQASPIASEMASPMATVMGSSQPGAPMDGGEMVGMYPVSSIPVPAHGNQELKPGGYHLMLMDPTGTLSAGQTVELTLTFRQAGPITVTATVQGA